ncbi:MAG: hypothetical protein ACR2KV_14055 [Solirubrobacteraceae bacterium]
MPTEKLYDEDIGLCLDCHSMNLQIDMYAVEVVRDMLRVAIGQALTIMSPGDVFETVREAVNDTGADGAASFETLRAQYRPLGELRAARVPRAAS